MKKSHWNMRPALCESEKLRKDIQNLEDALILHTRFQSDNDGSVRGLIRKEIGGSYWEHGGEGKLTTYKSSHDLVGQESRKHDFGRQQMADNKKQLLTANVQDSEVDRLKKDEGNVDTCMDKSIGIKLSKPEKAKLSSAKKKLMDTAEDGEKPVLEVTHIKTKYSSKEPDGMVCVRDLGQEIIVKKTRTVNECSAERQERPSARKANRSAKKENRKLKEKYHNISNDVLPDFSGILDFSSMKVKAPDRAGAKMIDQKKCLTPLIQEAVNESTYTFHLCAQNTERKSNMEDSKSNTDIVQTSSLDSSSRNENKMQEPKFGPSVGSGDQICEYDNLKKKSVNFYFNILNNTENDNSGERAASSDQTVRPDIKESSKASHSMDSWTSKTWQADSNFNNSCTDFTTDSIMTENWRCHSEPYKSKDLTCRSSKDNFLKNKQKEHLDLDICFEGESPKFIGSPAAVLVERVSLPSQTSPVALYSDSVEIIQHVESRPKNDKSSGDLSNMFLCSHMDTAKYTSASSPPGVSHSLSPSWSSPLPTSTLSKERDSDQVPQTHLSGASDHCPVSTVRYISPAKLSDGLDTDQFSRSKNSCGSEVESWLHSLGLHSVDHFVQIFSDHKIDMAKAHKLTTSDLRGMGIHDLGPLMKIMKGVQVLGRSEAVHQNGKKNTCAAQNNHQSEYLVRRSHELEVSNESLGDSSHGMRYGVDDVNVNFIDLEQVSARTLGYRILESPVLSKQIQRLDSILPSQDKNNKSKSVPLATDVTSQKVTSDENKKHINDRSKAKDLTEVIKSNTKHKKIINKSQASCGPNVKRSNSTFAGKPPSITKAFDHGLSNATHMQKVKQQQKIKQETDKRSAAEQEQCKMKCEMAIRHSQRTRSSSMERAKRKDQSSRLERSASLSSIKGTFDKVQATELKNFIKSEKDDRKNVPSLTRRVRKQLSHVEKQPVLKDIRKLQHQVSNREESSDFLRYNSFVGIPELRNLLLDDEASPCVTEKGRTSSAERRNSRNAMRRAYADEKERLKIPVPAMAHDSGGNIETVKSDFDKPVLQPYQDKFNKESPNSESPAERLCHSSRANITHKVNISLYEILSVGNVKTGHDVVDPGNSSLHHEVTGAPRKTRTASLKSKESRSNSLRGRDTSLVRRASHNQSERHMKTDLGFGSVMDRLKKVEINRKDVIFSENDLIGCGTFSQVFKGIYQGSEVAVKRLKAPLQNRDISYFAAEVSILQGLKHPHVVKLLGVCSSRDKLPFVVMELVACGSLNTWLHDSRRSNLNQNEFYQITRDVSAGMLYLHNHQPQVLHLNLKPKNILIEHDSRAKVADFGFSKLKHETDVKLLRSSKSQFIRDMPAWTAPEMLTSGEITLKADVYSFGMVMWEMLTRQTPYDGLSVFQILEHIQVNKRPTIPDNCPRGLSWLVNKCWGQNPASRPGFKEVLDCLEHLSGTGEWKVPDEEDAIHLDEVFSIHLTQESSETCDHIVEGREVIPDRRRNSKTAEIELVSLSSQEDEDSTDDDRKCGQSKYFVGSRKIIAQDSVSCVDTPFSIQTKNDVTKRGSAIRVSSSDFSLQLSSTSSRQISSAPDFEENSKKDKPDSTQGAIQSYSPFRDQHFCVSKSHDHIAGASSFQKLLPQCHSSDRLEAPSFSNSSFSSQSSVVLPGKRHFTGLPGDKTASNKNKSLVTNDGNNKNTLSPHSMTASGRQKITEGRISSSSLHHLKKDVQNLYMEGQPYVPSFHDDISSADARNSRLKPRLVQDCSSRSSGIVLHHETGVGCSENLAVQPISSSMESLNASSGLNFDKTFDVRDVTSTSGHVALTAKADSGHSHGASEEAENSSTKMKENKKLVPDKSSTLVTNISHSEWADDDRGQVSVCKVQGWKEYMGTEGTFLPEEFPYSDFVGTSRREHVAEASKQITHKDNVVRSIEQITNTEAVVRDSEQITNTEAVVRDSEQITNTEAVVRDSEQITNTEAVVRDSEQITNTEAVVRDSEQITNTEAVVRDSEQITNTEAVVRDSEQITNTENVAESSKKITHTDSFAVNIKQSYHIWNSGNSLTNNNLPGNVNAKGFSEVSNDNDVSYKLSKYLAAQGKRAVISTNESQVQVSDTDSDSSIPDDISEDSLSKENLCDSLHCFMKNPDCCHFKEEVCTSAPETVLGGMRKGLLVFSILKGHHSEYDTEKESFYLSSTSVTNPQSFQVAHLEDSKVQFVQRGQKGDTSRTSDFSTEAATSEVTLSEKMLPAFCAHTEKKSSSEVSVVFPSSCSDTCPRSFQQELHHKTGLISSITESKKDHSLEDGAVQQKVPKSPSQEQRNYPVISPLLFYSHVHHYGRPSRPEQSSKSNCLHSHRDKVLKPKECFIVHEKQTLSESGTHTRLSVDPGMLLAQRRVLKAVVPPDLSASLQNMTETKQESTLTVADILKKAMTDRRFAMRDVQESQDVSSESSWSVQD